MSDFTKYKLCPSWSFSELTDLCCGLYPNSVRESFDELNWAQEMINRACLAGDLPFKEPIDASSGDRLYGHHRFFKPADAVQWAMPLFPNFPKELHELASNNSKRCQKNDDELSRSEREYHLRTIGSLALLLIEKSVGNKFGTREKPNKSAIYTEIQQLLSDMNVSEKGQGRERLNNVLKKAIGITLED